MTVESIMSTRDRHLRPGDTVSTAIKAIHESHIRNLPVLDDEGRFLGVFGVRQVVDLLLPRVAQMEHGLEDLSFMPDELGELFNRLNKVGEEPVANHMADRDTLRICTPGTPFPEVLELLHQSIHTSLPVIVADNGERLSGMVSAWDVLEKLVINMVDSDARAGDAG